MLLSGFRYFRYFDWFNFILTFTIASIGLLFIFSATYTLENPYSIFLKKQAIGLSIGVFIYLASCMTDHRYLMRWGYIGYLLVIGMLLFTLAKGSIGMGAQRWISLGFIRLQPSELAKLLFPSFAAYHFHAYKNAVLVKFYDYIPVLFILAISFVLIVKQPDLGTGLLILFVGSIMLWLAGISNKFFLWCIFIGFIGTPLVWKTLKPYQKNRIAVFFGQGDTKKERYQIEQSAIAIGSGGFFGKGFLNGTQNKLRFLPESRTDFIFAVLCEEWGFIGALAILILYILLFARLFNTILQIQAPDIQLFATGIILHIVLSTIINIGMIINLLPIVGIPLPLMSYGLSNLWVILASLGWFQSISMRQLGMGK